MLRQRRVTGRSCHPGPEKPSVPAPAEAAARLAARAELPTAASLQKEAPLAPPAPSSSDSEGGVEVEVKMEDAPLPSAYDGATATSAAHKGTHRGDARKGRVLGLGM